MANASGRIRTDTLLQEWDFKSHGSTNSPTDAEEGGVRKDHFRINFAQVLYRKKMEKP